MICCTTSCLTERVFLGLWVHPLQTRTVRGIDGRKIALPSHWATMQSAPRGPGLWCCVLCVGEPTCCMVDGVTVFVVLWTWFPRGPCSNRCYHYHHHHRGHHTRGFSLFPVSIALVPPACGGGHQGVLPLSVKLSQWHCPSSCHPTRHLSLMLHAQTDKHTHSLTHTQTDTHSLDFSFCLFFCCSGYAHA